MPLVVAGVVNWNGRQLLLECLESLCRINYPTGRLRVIVIDNGSDDGSSEAVQRSHPEVDVVRNRDNQGYVRAVNQVVARGIALGARYIWVLNNDVVADPDSLSRMVEVAEADDHIGIISPVVYPHDEPTSATNVGYEINHWTGQMRRLVDGQDVFTAQDETVAEVDSSIGCSNLIRTRVFEEIGLFRPIYEIYFEETDFAVRAQRAGYSVVVVRQARAVHRNAATMNRHLLRRAWLLARNLFLFQCLNASPRHLAVFVPYYFGVHLPYFLLRGSWHGLSLKLGGFR